MRKKKEKPLNDGIDAVTIIFYRVFPWVDFLMDFVLFLTKNAARENLRIKNKVDPFPFYLNPAISTTTKKTQANENINLYICYFFLWNLSGE